MNKVPLQAPSSHLDYLPAVYRQGEEDDQANFLGLFLKIFEKLLSGVFDDVRLELELPDGGLETENIVGVEEILAQLHEYFDPLFTTPFQRLGADAEEFLEYLSKWVALALNQNWSENRKRRILQKIVPLYRKRGTAEGLKEYLRTFVGPNVTVEEQLEGIQVGLRSTVGFDTLVGGAPPYFFFVRIILGIEDLAPDRPDRIDPVFFSNLVLLTAEIIDLEKPAHTYYSIRYDVPGIIVGRVSHVGTNTLIGSRSIPRFIF